MEAIPYETLPEPPEHLSPGSLLSRIVEGLLFRFRWATEGLTDADGELRPEASAMSLGELVAHVHDLAQLIDGRFGGAAFEPGSRDATLTANRAATVRRLLAARDRLLTMSADAISRATFVSPRRGDELPFWNIVTGPLSDALTHVGQINGWRRIHGNPSPGHDVLRGRPRA